ncbi:MAG: tRNA (5-methylaminomethyl-2-thiouridine)(34)-methyltransferase MnmD [Saprospiraceae bacterium]
MPLTEHIITSDGSSTLRSIQFQSSYHSIHGALTESKHVFIQHGLDFLSNKKEATRVFEFGFGTGLNTWLTISNAEKNEKHIYYEAIEMYPLPDSEWKLLNYPEIHSFNGSVDFFEKIHNSKWNQSVAINGYFELKKIHINWLEYHTTNKFDIVFFDAFAPEVQEDLWTIESLTKLYNLLDINGILVSYCAKGIFRRNLKEVGFKVEKLQGPPGKREMTRAHKN